MTTHACVTYDFTMPEMDIEEFLSAMKFIFKKYEFQLEQGDEGYRHYQGRGTLFKKRRASEVKTLLRDRGLEKMHISPTTNNALNEAVGYHLKDDTRIGGPWSSNDVAVYTPRQYRNINLYPWQQAVLTEAQTFNPRTVNYIYDPVGASGKSTIASLCCLHHRGLRVPPVNDHEKLLASVCDILSARDDHAPGAIFIDLPRYMDKRRLHGIYAAVEELKNGHAYDMRFHYKEWWFDSPSVWMFANTKPCLEALSRDRFKFWVIRYGILVPFVPELEE